MRQIDAWRNMLFLVAVFLVSGVLLLAAINAEHGIYWAGYVCDLTGEICDQPGLLLIVSFAALIAGLMKWLAHE